PKIKALPTTTALPSLSAGPEGKNVLRRLSRSPLSPKYVGIGTYKSLGHAKPPDAQQLAGRAG
ncbi:MAG: hypothetical protein SPJ12_04865, partial [Duodenibacillus sp.]|nr:hypothetical protein [Duodenibacillus sp.]